MNDEDKEVGFDGFLGSNEARKEYLNKDSGGEKETRENDDTIIGVETICPKCGYKLNYHFFRGKEFISEFVEDLLYYRVEDVIKKWEEKLK